MACLHLCFCYSTHTQKESAKRQEYFPREKRAHTQTVGNKYITAHTVCVYVYVCLYLYKCGKNADKQVNFANWGNGNNSAGAAAAAAGAGAGAIIKLRTGVAQQQVHNNNYNYNYN